MRVPRLFVTYRERIGGHRVPVVVLEVIDFDAKRLGITRVVRVCGPPRALGVQAFEAERFARARQLLGKEYTGFPRACQQVYAAICGDKDAHINCMDAFEVYVRGDFDPFLLGTWCERKEKHGEEIVERFSPMLAAAVAKTFDEPPAMRPHSPTAQWEGWITVGEGRPYSHINTPPQSVEAAVQRMMREASRACSPPPPTHANRPRARAPIREHSPARSVLATSRRGAAPSPTRSRRARCATARSRTALTRAQGGRRSTGSVGSSSSPLTSARESSTTRTTRTSSSGKARACSAARRR